MHELKIKFSRSLSVVKHERRLTEMKDTPESTYCKERLILVTLLVLLSSLWLLRWFLETSRQWHPSRVCSKTRSQISEWKSVHCEQLLFESRSLREEVEESSLRITCSNLTFILHLCIEWSTLCSFPVCYSILETRKKSSLLFLSTGKKVSGSC